jgi:hypothetical protein
MRGIYLQNNHFTAFCCHQFSFPNLPVSFFLYKTCAPFNKQFWVCEGNGIDRLIAAMEGENDDDDRSLGERGQRRTAAADD